MRAILLQAVLAVSLAIPTTAGSVGIQVELAGTVLDSNFGGTLADVQPGDPVVFLFTVDSEDFVDSKIEPVRGYVIDVASFDLIIGSVFLDVRDPYPNGTAQFALRDDTPADAVFFTRDAGVHDGLALVHVPTAATYAFFGGVSFDETTFGSLDILEAIGTHDASGGQGVLFGSAGPAGPSLDIVFDELTISAAVPVGSATWGAIKARDWLRSIAP